jgi:hypothetical protein
MPKHDLEGQLAALTQEFVGKLVEVIRNASFVEVAALSTPRVAPSGGAPRTRGPAPRPAREPSPSGSRPRSSSNGEVKHPRQTAARRAELADRVVTALSKAAQPLGVRALSGELGVAPDLLAVPLRELRAAGRIQKHGEKRNTTYSAA